MRLLSGLILVLPLIGLLPGAAFAEEHYREGRLVLGGYLGVGNAWLGSDVPVEDSSERGLGGNFRIGYGMSPEWFVGIETSAWADVGSNDVGETDISFQTFGPSVAWYPGAKGFYLRGILGWSWLSFSVQPTGESTYKSDTSGWGASFATGFEWRITPSLAIGPQIDLGYLDVGEVQSLTTSLGERFDFSAYWVNLTLFAVLYL
jgi:hypothetical protein